MTINIETVIDTIKDYKNRFYESDQNDVLLDKICGDLIALFEAYQRK